MTTGASNTRAGPRPYVFVGSSNEGLKAAQAVQANLGDTCEVAIWDKGVFGLSQGTLASLVCGLGKFDFAVLVLTPDDVAVKRGEAVAYPRDNVLFEAGLFMGRLGTERTFIVCQKGTKLPSDLAGITVAQFQLPDMGNMQDALGPACVRIRESISKHGPTVDHSTGRLVDATKSVDAVGRRMDAVLPLLARSKLIETEIFLEDFGPRVDENKRHELKKSVDDLSALLKELEDAGRGKE